MKKISYILLGVCSLLIVGCSSFLDTLPDNRAEVDTAEKVRKLLVSAYPNTSYILTAEMSSDNVDDSSSNNPYANRFTEQIFNWRDSKESDNESPTRIWGSCYKAIASANQALKSIDEIGYTEDMAGIRGEALICRAYSHFLLVNIFGQHINEQTSATDLGVTYITEPETSLNPKYTRETVLSNYKNIEKDLTEGLSLISKAVFDIPKYHFNPKAAYAFATRFYLYKADWENAIKYADLTLGAHAEALLRDNELLSSYPTEVLSKQYGQATVKANLLLMTTTSSLGVTFGPYYSNSKINHKNYLALTETNLVESPWAADPEEDYFLRPAVYIGTNLDKTLSLRLPYLFEIVDPVSQTGYNKTVFPAFTADEALLSRAEAKVHMKDYAGAIADLNSWIKVNVKNFQPVEKKQLTDWVSRVGKHTPKQPKPFKELHPSFSLEQGEQEQLLQVVLFARRLETLHMGLRWFDIKRYGIEVVRRVVDGKLVLNIGETLSTNDKRCAIQLPQEVILAGLEANPR